VDEVYRASNIECGETVEGVWGHVVNNGAVKWRVGSAASSQIFGANDDSRQTGCFKKPRGDKKRGRRL
jgi:hypothetical protein